ncbi:zinc finger protein 839 isoform X2 [Antechinus flavipes]|uniref:zinc finger protein 839 isoform X2 n=1 Tax=Antechinus flavipes TaxID=38775 RepID=UPI0022369756|nr:zinc finger protein 839 isoform X2 [Antechinus flavipes]
MAEAEAEENGEDGDIFREPLASSPGRTAVCVPPAGSVEAAPVLLGEAESLQPAYFSPAAPLAPEDLQRVLEQVRKAPPPPPPRPPGTAGLGPRGSCSFSVVHDAARRLQDAAQQVAQHWGPDLPPPPPRLLQPKELEAIRVKVKSGERPMPPLAAIRPKTITLSQPFNGNTDLLGLSVVNPSIIRIQPLMRTEQQTLVNTLPPPPLQLLVQRPLPPLAPVSVEKFMGHKVLNGQRTTFVPLSASNTSTIPSASVTASSAGLLISTPENECTEKIKKSIKVKTRSGRISRPPKYKAKDYKFIKTEDLADGHQSDSDDYSELNVEEEDDKKGKDTLFNSSSDYLKPKTFKCQTCEKSYIGQGGLARHYKLNPDHGQLEPKVLISNKPDGRGEVGSATINKTTPEPSVPAALNSESTLAPCMAEQDSTWNGQQNCDSKEVGTLLESDQKNGFRLACWGSRKTRGSKRKKLKASAKSGCSGKHSNSVQLTSCTGVAIEQNKMRNKARLKELLQQCDHEDLMELVLPRLTKLVTVYEFLLMKVAESLGITEEFLQKEELKKNDISPQNVLSAIEAGLGEVTRQKRENEILEVPLPVKRTRIESGSKNMKDNYASHNGLQEKTILLCSQVNTEGLKLHLNRTTSQSSEKIYNMAVDFGSQILQNGQLPKAVAEVEGKNEPPKAFADESKNDPASSVILYQAVKETQTYSQLENPGSLLQEQTELLPEYSVHDHPPDQNTSDKSAISDFCCTVLSEKDSCWSGHEIHNRRENEDCKSHQEFFNPENEIHELTSKPEKILSTDVPTDNSCQTSLESQHHSLLEASMSTESILENASENLHQFPESLQDVQMEQESAIAVDNTVAFEIANESQELSQEQEQIFIQTSDGLILSHPGTVVSEANDIVIVTDVDGNTVHISTSDGLPLETLEALLAVEREPE